VTRRRSKVQDMSLAQLPLLLLLLLLAP